MQEISSNINWSATAAMIAAIVALFSLIISPIVTYKIAKKQISTTVLSNERKEWINSLQSDISAFVSQAMFLASGYHSLFYPKEKTVEILEQVFALHIQIQLKLNLSISSHKNLEEIVNKIASELEKLSTKSEDYNLIVKYLEEIVPSTRIVVQEELKQIRYIN
jgi:uncharacterized paraquat-inducible protein A